MTALSGRERRAASAIASPSGCIRTLCVWLWRLDVVNRRDAALACDAVLVQDLGLGDQGFLMNNEAYVSQYLDHHIARHPRLDHVMMSRQNLSQGGTYPWVEHGCLEGAAGFATDFRQLMGPEPS